MQRPCTADRPQPEGPTPPCPGPPALGPNRGTHRPPQLWVCGRPASRVAAGCPGAAPPEPAALRPPELPPVPWRVSPYLHKEAAVLDAEAAGSCRKALDDHLGIILVGVIDAQQARAGGAHTQPAEAEEGWPGKVAQNQHGGILIRVLLLAAPRGPAPPAGLVGGAAVPPRRCGDGARGHGRAGAEQRLRTAALRQPPLAGSNPRLRQSPRGPRRIAPPPCFSANRSTARALSNPPLPRPPVSARRFIQTARARGTASAAREGSEGSK